MREKRHERLTAEILKGPSGPMIGAFFDLDHTLLAGFSAVSFIRERLLSGRMAPREIADSLLGTFGFALGRTGFSGMMAASTAAYRGLSESVLEEIGDEVFVKYLATQIYPESRALVEAHQRMGHTVAIVSSATRYQADPLARDMGIEHVLCTQLEVQDGIFTGRVVHPTCYGEGKAIAARKLARAHKVSMKKSYFYTDSHEDLPLLDAVGHPHPLNPNRQLAQIARERRWPVHRFRSRGTPGLGDLVRTSMVYGSMVPSVWVGAAAGLISGSRREAVNVAAAMWSDLATSLSGVDLRVEGEQHLWSHRPAVFIFNHQSGLDPILLFKMLRRDLTGVGKQEILHNPIFGPVFAAAGVVFIDRADPARAIEALEPAVQALGEGISLAIAPEGTRSLTPRIGRFKKGAFHIAMQAGVPIVPIVFRNVLDALPKDALVVRPSTVEAVVLPPVDTSKWTVRTLDKRIPGHSREVPRGARPVRSARGGVRGSLPRPRCAADATSLLFLLLVVLGSIAPSLGESSSQAETAAIERGRKAFACAVRRGEIAGNVLTVIDYTLPSTEPRFWVLQMPQGQVLFHELVAHGRNSGEGRAEHFSNRHNSKQSSLGLFRTAETYYGRHGYSLRLDGLEAGVNDNARERFIVIHGADYVSPEFAAAHGRLGRSWGCPALPRSRSRAIIDRIRDGNAVFAYYDDPSWLGTSRYLNGCEVSGGESN